MSKQIQVIPVVHRLMKFMTLIEEGKFKIPTFQRDFVWEDKEKIELFDSISKEYPIGSILLWQPKDKFANQPKIGPYTIDHSENSNFYYVLDGFQRLSTLFGCLTNPNKTRLSIDGNRLEKDFTMFYSLEDEAFKMRKASSITDIPVYKLIDTYEFLDFIDNLRNELKGDPNIISYIERAKKLSSILIDYQIPSVEIFGGTINDAVDIFSRVNSKGIEISPDWMLSALTSNEENDFNLGVLLGDLLDDLQEFNFGSLKREVLVQCIQNSFGEVYFEQTIEKVAARRDFQEVSIKSIQSIKKSIIFLFEELLVIDRKLLPYNYQLIFLTHFFNNVENPNSVQVEKLKKWFWITTYSNYFTIYNLSKIRQAFNQFMSFTNNEIENPVFYANPNQLFITADLPASVSSGSVRSKAFQLFLLNWAKGFSNVHSENIDSLKIKFLYRGNRSHSGLIPLILFTRESDINPPFEFNKPTEMSYLLNDNCDITLRNKYFLTDNMIDFHLNGSQEEVLKERIKMIESEEREFVRDLDILYNNIVEEY